MSSDYLVARTAFGVVAVRAETVRSIAINDGGNGDPVVTLETTDGARRTVISWSIVPGDLVLTWLNVEYGQWRMADRKRKRKVSRRSQSADRPQTGSRESASG